MRTDTDVEAIYAGRLKEIREAAGLSQAALAALLAEQAGLALDPTAITRLERGQRGIGLREACALARVLQVPLGQLCTPGGEVTAPEPAAAVPGDGQWMRIAFMGHIEYTGYVTEITKNGQPAYRVDLPEKIWGGNPLAWVEHAASAWFSDRPVTEESVRKAWEAQVRRAEERARQEAEWRRMQERRAITADAVRDLEHESGEDEGYDEDGGVS